MSDRKAHGTERDSFTYEVAIPKNSGFGYKIPIRPVLFCKNRGWWREWGGGRCMFDGHHLHGKQAIETNKVTLPCFSKTNVHLTENVNIPQWNSNIGTNHEHCSWTDQLVKISTM